MRVSKEVKIGLSALVVLVMVYWGINFLKGLNVVERNNLYHLSLEDATGIEVSSALLVRGYRVGSVTDMKLHSMKSNIVVEIIVRRNYQIPVDSYVQIAEGAIMDAPTLKLVPGVSSDYYQDGDTIPFVKVATMMDKFNTVAGQLVSLTSTLQATVTQVNKLLAQENIDNLSVAMKNVKDVTGNLNNMVVTQNRNLDRILKNAEMITQTLNEATPDFKEAIANINKLSGGLSETLPQTVDRINALLEKINSTDGTIGKLLNDDSAYNDLDKALVDLSALLTDLKKNPKRYVHFSLFGKKDKPEKDSTDTSKSKKR